MSLEGRRRHTNSGLGHIVSVRPSIAPTPLLAAALVLKISTSEAIGAGFGWLDIVIAGSDYLIYGLFLNVNNDSLSNSASSSC
jgi:hypothetical protein